MKNKILAKIKVLWPFFLSGIILLAIIVLVVPEFSWLHFLLFIATISLGFLVGNLNTPAVRFREKKVKMQSKELLKLNKQMKIQAAAIESAANGIIITDIDGIVQWVNPGFTRLTGYSKEDIIGESLKKIKSGHHDAKFFEDLWKTIKSGKVWHNEIINKRKDGSLYTEEMTITPVLDDKGSISSFVAIKHDISQRKKLEEISAREKERMSSELNVAREIQMSMLNHTFPPYPEREDLDIYASLIPAREVGGDFYDFFWIDDERFCFLVGDVSGKGVPAALMMAVTKTLLKSSVIKENSLARSLTFVNNEISRDNDNNMFITAFICILNTTTGYLTYANAGHTPSYVLCKSSNETRKLDDLSGVVIGAMEGLEYNDNVLKLERGDAVFVYTDGITEARDKNNKLFTEKNLEKLFSSHQFISSENLIKEVYEAVLIHENGAEPADDITALCVYFREQEKGALVDYLFTSIENNIESIRPFQEKFGDFAERHNISTEALQQLNIVFDELLSNTIKYAYSDNNLHEIEIKIRFYKDKLTVTLMDDGIPFNPFDQMGPDTSLSVEDRDIGGLGVHLVKFLVDDYNYEYREQISKNSTHFTKHLR